MKKGGYGAGLWRQCLRQALPAAAEMLLNGLTALTGTLMAGRLGAEALATVGLTVQPRLMQLCLFSAAGIGATAAVAGETGGKNEKGAAGVWAVALWVTVVLAAVETVLSCIFAEEIMRFAAGGRGTKQPAADAAVSFFRTVSLSLLPSALSICIGGGLRGMGRAGAALWVNLTVFLTNAALIVPMTRGLLFFPEMGVQGIAGAAAVSAAAGCAAAGGIMAAGRKEKRLLRWGGKPAPGAQGMRILLRTGGNAAAEQAGLRIGYFFCTRMLYGLGTGAFAANQACAQLLNLTFFVGDGLGAAATALVRREAGGGKGDRARQCGNVCFFCALIGAAAIGVFLLCVRRPLAGWLVGAENGDAAQVRTLVASTLPAVALAQLFQMTASALGGAMRGMGDNRFVAFVYVGCVAGLRVLLSDLAVRVWRLSLPGVWLAATAETAVRLLCLGIRYMRLQMHKKSPPVHPDP